MFTAYPTYSQFRSLQFLKPNMQGEDVYALQTALNECDFNCGTADGVLGPATAAAIVAAQKGFFLTVDGKAGGDTQKALALEIAHAVSTAFSVPLEAFHGQLEHESSFRLGRYSPQRSDGNYDAGVAQRNTKYTPSPQGFDAKLSIWELGQVVRKHYTMFEGLRTRRRWALAQGAWNAPAYACYIAREEGATKVRLADTEKPSPAARTTLEEYIASVSAYLKV